MSERISTEKIDVTRKLSKIMEKTYRTKLMININDKIKQNKNKGYRKKYDII